jgi:hypothetical protein
MKRFGDYGWILFYACIFFFLAYDLAVNYKTYSIWEIIEIAILLVLLIWNALAVFSKKKPAIVEQKGRNKFNQYAKIIVKDPKILLCLSISVLILCHAAIEYQTYSIEKIIRHAVFFALFTLGGIIILERKLRVLKREEKLKKYDKVLIKNPVVLAVIVFLVLSVLIICDGVINYQTYSIGKFIVRSVFLVFFILISILFLKGGVRPKQ